MKILLNNREEEFPREPISVSELISMKKFSFRMRIIKVNGIFIPQDQYGSTLVRDGDRVQMHYLMSGG